MGQMGKGINGAKEPNRLPRRRKGKSTKRGLSKEQIPLLVGKDRTGNSHISVLSGFSFKHINPVIEQIVEPDSILCTDGARIYHKIGRVTGMKVVQMNTKKGIMKREGIYHIQNSNSYQSRFKEFVARFKGPATKYLEHYVKWFMWWAKTRSAQIKDNLFSVNLFNQHCA